MSTKTKVNKHILHPDLQTSQVNVALVGCGGSGSQMLTGLARLHVAMLACGHPGGLHVRAYDPDVVTTANVGRQLFSRADVGQPKACVLIQRVNLFYGLDWRAIPERYDLGRGLGRGNMPANIVITCVDSAASRREVHQILDARHTVPPQYWLDMGNMQHEGQVILGQPGRQDWPPMRTKDGKRGRLPTVIDIYPELLDAGIKEDDTPSCSLAESLLKQDLFVNDHVAKWALQALWTLFREGSIVHHGYVINLKDGLVNPIPVPQSA